MATMRNVQTSMIAALTLRVPIDWTAEQIADVLRESFVVGPSATRAGGMRVLDAYVGACESYDISELDDD